MNANIEIVIHDFLINNFLDYVVYNLDLLIHILFLVRPQIF